jgi:hypothetical protein
MFTVWGAKQRLCDGISRRNFLKIGAFGTGLTLADMLRQRAMAGTSTKKAAKSVIMVFLSGGPSHIDSYDLKPEAPIEFRGEFKPIATKVPGVQICEHLPLQAAMWDKLAVIRSLTSTNGHSDHEVMTGYNHVTQPRGNQPSMGSVVSKLRSSVNAGVTPYVAIPMRNGQQEWVVAGDYPGYLGVSHRPFTVHGPGVQDLLPARGLAAARLGDRKALLSSFDTLRRDLDAKGTLTAMDNHKVRAFDVIASGAVRKALDLSLEDPKTVQRYNAGPKDFTHSGDKFLLARRLVEAGVGCVTLSIGGFDGHAGNFKGLRFLLPIIDRGMANLIQDLHDRGMDQDVVTVMWGEFGRTPKVGGDPKRAAADGRDHWPPAMSAVIAGGGLKMGQTIGSTTARAETPKDRPYRVPQVLSTIYHALGIDPAQTFPNGSGRPMYILDDRDPVTELL